MADTRWIEVPLMLDDQWTLHVRVAFDEAGVEYRTETVTTSVGVEGGQHAYAFHVGAEDVRAAARILRRVLGISDPARLDPLEGECPACGAVTPLAVWTCPSCELSFKPTPEEMDDPMIRFLRDHWAFVGEEEEEEDS